VRYLAKLTHEGKHWLAELPDCPGCQTFGDTRAAAIVMAREALEGWLEVHLADGEAPPRPRRRSGVEIPVNPRLSVALQIRWLREDRHLTQAQLARLVGVSQQQIAKLEKPDGNPTLSTLESVARGAGVALDVRLVA
jgi:predicted RNase H-like HicB family nuclease/DNA-binding XRE family transcriptional regulator